MKYFVSNVCRVNVTPELAALAISPGIHVIPESVLQPRQVRIKQTDLNIPATMRYHRDAYVPVIATDVAADLVREGKAEYAEQRLLVYSMDDYLSDPDVQADNKEFEKADAAQSAGAEVVIVAVIGENRSPLSVVRNIVSGCQKPESLEADAKGAIEAASVFLIED